jgi:hypothetical protein
MAVLVKREDSHGSFGGKGRRAMAAWSERLLVMMTTTMIYDDDDDDDDDDDR